MELRLSLTGLDGLLDAFSREPAVVRRNMRNAVEESLEIVKEEARATHRFQPRTGRLASSVEKAMTGNSSGVVFLNSAVAPHAASIHDGSRPHVILPKNKKVLRWASGGRFVRALVVHHPGTKPDPFLVNAGERRTPDIERRIQQGIDKSIAEVGL